MITGYLVIFKPKINNNFYYKYLVDLKFKFNWKSCVLSDNIF